MDLKRCSNGHFYDADAYMSCPHCGGGNVATTNPASNNFAGGFEDAPTERMDIFGGFDAAGAAGVADDSLNATMPLGALIDDVKNEAEAKADEQEVTVSYYKGAIGSEPVVGWLVCIEGNHFGEDFKLRAGKNFIGRASDMDVCLSGDSSVSRDKHAIVLFEPRENLFIVQAGESKELSYHNDQLVLAAKELKAYDVIKVGATKLMFVPFCGDKFSWKKDEE